MTGWSLTFQPGSGSIRPPIVWIGSLQASQRDDGRGGTPSGGVVGLPARSTGDRA
jgi:hypothetical protein